MGRNNGSKSKQSLKGSGALADYFNAAELRPSAPAESGTSGKMAPEMAPEIASEKTDAASLTRQDLIDLGADLKAYFDTKLAQSISPIAQQLTDLSSSLKEVSGTADAAMELGLAVREETKRLQHSEQQLGQKIAALEAQMRATNLKFRGLPESPEFNANLIPSLASWLASVLHLEDGVAPTILSAYRLGPQSAARPNFPRDVVAQFLYPRSRNAILQRARTGGPLKFEDCTIQVLLDLAPDVLAKRRLLKPITECLHNNKIRFRWSPASDVLVYKEGRQYHAEDLASGKDLLLALKLRLPADLTVDKPCPSSEQG